jgi:hypothetical protein
MTWKQALFLSGYGIFFITSAFAMIWWQRRQRKSRKPFGDDFKLLRGPGESQFRIYLQREENEIFWVLGYALLPMLVALAGLQFVELLPAVLQLAALGLTVVAFISAFIFAARLYSRRTLDSFNRYLGYFGERIVAEHLEPLKGQGWRILHDVPFENNGTKYNIDHIAIGPQGVFAIETKTRRKGSARPGFDDHKVFFDGRDLEWPWGNDNHGLEQAERNAVALAKTIKDETGDRVHVTPILTLPGWFVEPRPSRESRLCRVANAKALPKFIAAGPSVLTADKVAAIANKLEPRCRDVEY